MLRKSQEGVASPTFQCVIRTRTGADELKTTVAAIDGVVDSMR